MTDINESRPWPQKGEFGGSFSDADSGYDDPGVLTIPVVRTVFHNDSDGRKISTTSTEWISVQRRNDKDELTGCGHLQSPNGSRKTHSQSTASLDSHQSSLNRTIEDESSEDLDHPGSSSEFLNRPNFSLLTDLKMDSFDWNDFEVSRFQKEHKIEDERERKMRFLSAPRDKRGKPLPTIRDICTSQRISLKEETTKRVPRKRFRSKSADGRRITGAQSLFSPTYSKVLSPETMRRRKIWADVIKRDCILEEEYYKIPYEECNKEIILGRYSSPDALLYNFRRLKKQSYDTTCEDKSPLKKDKNPNKNELISYIPKKEQRKNCEDEKYIKSLLYDKNKDTNLMKRFGWKEDDVSTPLIYQNKTHSATDQIQQLINDLNEIAFSDLKSDFEKGNFVDIHKNNNKLTPLEPEYKDSKEFSDNHPDSLITEMANLSGKSHEKLMQAQSKQEKKIKTKKKVSFSNENDEMVFDSSFSDSESSVFEDKNENELFHSSTNENEDCFALSKDKTHSHDSFVINHIAPHNQRALPSSEEVNKTSLKTLNSHKINDATNINPSLGRYDKLLASPHVIHSLNAQNIHAPMHEELLNEKNHQRNHQDMKKHIPVTKRFNLNDPSFTMDTPFYNSLPYEKQKENVSNKKKKTNKNNGNFRKDKINIYMTKGASFADHEIYFSTCTSTPNPNVTVSRIRVPLSSIRDQWQWAFYLQQEMKKNKRKYPHDVSPPNCYSPLSSPNTTVPSPTPSCESSASLSENSSATSGSSVERYSPPFYPLMKNKGTIPTSL